MKLSDADLRNISIVGAQMVICGFSVAQGSALDTDELIPTATETLVRMVRWDNDLPKGEKGIEVYKASAGTNPSAAAQNLFMHRPIWAFVQNESGQVQNAVQALGSGERWRVRLVLSSPFIQAYFAGEVRADSNANTSPNFRADLVKVIPFNVLSGELKCYEAMSPQVLLARGTLLNESPFSDSRLALIDVPNPNELRSAISEKKARCDITYQYLRRQLSAATSITTLKANTLEQVEQLEEAEKARNNVSFSTDVAKIKQMLQAEINTVIVTNDPSLIASLPQFTDAVMGRLFKVTDFDFSTPPSALKTAIESYLQSDAQIAVNSQTETERRNSESEQGISLGIDVKIFKFTTDMKNKFLGDHSITQEQRTTTNTVIPGKIKIYQLNDNWRSVLVQNISSIIASKVAIGTSVTDPTDFALSKADAERSLGAGAIAPTATGLLPGMSFCYFGAGPLPAGWVPLDGSPDRVWPTDPWVPLLLRGHKMPDMRGATAIGASNVDEVGSSKLDTSIRLPAFPIISPRKVYALNPSPVNQLIGKYCDDNSTGDCPWREVKPYSYKGSPLPSDYSVPLSRFFGATGNPILAYQAKSGAVSEGYDWIQVDTLGRDGTVDLSDAKPIQWTDTNKQPYAKCRWVVKM